jgi:NifU-like protein involved in Fe-S cluster formation
MPAPLTNPQPHAPAEALYNSRILRLAAATADQHRLAAPQASATRVSPVCGSKVTADVTLDVAGCIVEFGIEVRACALGQAASSLVVADITGKDRTAVAAARSELADWLAGRREPAPAWPGMEVFAPARPHRARHPSILLSFDAVLAAVDAAIAPAA